MNWLKQEFAKLKAELAELHQLADECIASYESLKAKRTQIQSASDGGPGNPPPPPGP